METVSQIDYDMSYIADINSTNARLVTKIEMYKLQNVRDKDLEKEILSLAKIIESRAKDIHPFRLGWTKIEMDKTVSVFLEAAANGLFLCAEELNRVDRKIETNNTVCEELIILSTEIKQHLYSAETVRKSHPSSLNQWMKNILDTIQKMELKLEDAKNPPKKWSFFNRMDK